MQRRNNTDQLRGSACRRSRIGTTNLGLKKLETSLHRAVQNALWYLEPSVTDRHAVSSSTVWWRVIMSCCVSCIGHKALLYLTITSVARCRLTCAVALCCMPALSDWTKQRQLQYGSWRSKSWLVALLLLGYFLRHWRPLWTVVWWKRFRPNY